MFDMLLGDTSHVIRITIQTIKIMIILYHYSVANKQYRKGSNADMDMVQWRASTAESDEFFDKLCRGDD